jgi:hypothetical protein
LGPEAFIGGVVLDRRLVDVGFRVIRILLEPAQERGNDIHVRELLEALE